MASVLIAGCGYLGGRLAARLVEAGHSVWGLRRSPGKLPAGVRLIQADLLRPETLLNLPSGLEYVVYAAGADESSPQKYRAIYVQGLTHLLSALQTQEQKIKRVVFTSSTSVYEQTNGEWVDETSETCPSAYPGQILLEAEQMLWNGPFEGVTLRLAGLYGPQRTQLVNRVRTEKATLTGEPSVWTNRIHRDDAAGAVAHLLFLDPCHPVYIGVDDEPAPKNEVIRWLAERLSVNPPTGRGELRKKTTRGGNKRCSNARLRATGFHFRFPTYREGYGALLNLYDPGGINPRNSPEEKK